MGIGRVRLRWGQTMQESTRRVLDHVRRNPGCTIIDIEAALPDINCRQKVSNLKDMSHVWGERIPGHKCVRLYASVEAAKVEAVKLRGPADGTIVPPREIDYRQPWPDPYLSDAGVRSDGLQYRDCPSRRGSTLVYCYRRVQP
ncbi:MAG: hypothetical protein ACSLE9_03885 [Burkholderiaceae bacterium]